MKSYNNALKNLDQFLQGNAEVDLPSLIERSKTSDNNSVTQLLQHVARSPSTAGDVLLYSVTEACYHVAKFLLLSGADPNAQNEYGITSLMIASQRGRKDLLGLLIEKKANINAVSYFSANALFLVCREPDHANRDEIIKMLILHGLNPFYHSGKAYMNNHASNPLALYSDDILDAIALSPYTPSFAVPQGVDSYETIGIKRMIIARRERLLNLIKVYEDELSSHIDLHALLGTSRSVYNSISDTMPEPKRFKRSYDEEEVHNHVNQGLVFSILSDRMSMLPFYSDEPSKMLKSKSFFNQPDRHARIKKKLDSKKCNDHEHLAVQDYVYHRFR